MSPILVWLLVVGNVNTPIPTVLPERFANQQDCQTVATRMKNMDSSAHSAWSNFEFACIPAKIYMPPLTTTNNNLPAANK